MKINGDILYSLPFWLQEALVSTYGFLVYMGRRSGNYRSYLNEVKHNSSLDKASLDRLAGIQLEKSMQSAFTRVPAYQRHGEPLRQPGSSIHSRLKLLPFTEKRHLKDSPADYTVENIADLETGKVKTTGSTGSPLEITCDLESRKKNYAYFDWYIGLHGGKPRDKKVTIAGRKIVNSGRRKPPYWLQDRFNKTLYLSAYHISPDTLATYCKKLADFNPVYIDSYPSVIYEIAVYALENDYLLPQPKFICTSSETLFDYQRAAIEKAFKCPVRDQYGTAEMCIFGYECTHGNMHLRQDYSWVEVLPGEERGPGVYRGELVCTSFLNQAMPLLRYRLGDIAEVDFKSACECGTAHPILNHIEGRRDDILVGRSGRKYSRLSPLLKGFDIYESQFVLEDGFRLRVKIVPSSSSANIDTQPVAEKLESIFLDDFDLFVEIVDAIPRGKGGKFRSVINSAKGT